MALGNIRLWLMRELIPQRGTIISMRRRYGVSKEAMGDAVALLHCPACLTVIGSPNQNTALCQDVDEPALLPHASALLQATRR